MKPPALATWLLLHCHVGESLIGDLVERYHQRPSRLWFWRQTTTILALTGVRTLWEQKTDVLRAIIVGWAVIWTLRLMPLTKWVSNAMIVWEMDAARIWWFGGRPWPALVGLWGPSFTAGVLAGLAVGLLKTTRQIPVTLAFLCTVVLASGVAYLMWAQSLMALAKAWPLDGIAVAPGYLLPRPWWAARGPLWFLFLTQAWAYVAGLLGVLSGALCGGTLRKPIAHSQPQYRVIR
jgi:hypothetical protein